jgi:hypothetical protein
MSNIVTYSITKTYVGGSPLAGLTVTDTLRADKRLGLPFQPGQIVPHRGWSGGYRVESCVVEGGDA